METTARLEEIQRDIAACRRCPEMIGPPVHGAPVASRVLLVGQARTDHEADIGRPFAWTAGRTLFRWFQRATGADEDRIRNAVYFAAVARCFPGKARGGGDRRPDPTEIATCAAYLRAEVEALRPQLVIPVGTLAIAEVMGHRGRLADVVGTATTVTLWGHSMDAIPLPHPSGASTWFKTEPGVTLLGDGLDLLAGHPAMVAALA